MLALLGERVMIEFDDGGKVMFLVGIQDVNVFEVASHEPEQSCQSFSGIIGDQWSEGDVSCSVVRRCVLPDAFMAADGLFETFLTVMDQMGVYKPVIQTELNRYLPFLMTTTIMMAAVKRGVGRETAHEVIKEHAVAVSNDLRNGLIPTNDLLDRLGADGRLMLTREEIQEIYL